MPSRKIIINSDPFETRAVITESDMPVELFIESRDTEKISGCIFKGRVSKVISGTQSAFVDIGLNKDAFLALGGVEALGDDTDLKDIYRSPIQQMLKAGQHVLIQILKEPTSTKGPRSTMALSFPGRYLVFMPTIEHIGISRKIAQDRERDRLRSIAKRILPKGFGVIFRTAAEGIEEIDLKSDLDMLLKLWKNTEARARRSPPKTLLHSDASLTMKLVREYFTDDVEQVIIDSEHEYKSILDLCDFLSPLQRASLELYHGEAPIFEAFGIEKEIDLALQRKIWLASGGYIFIDRTEAMICIDVNSGRFAGGADLEETVFKVNMEAAEVIARQIRIRNLAGMIIIDFIDMSDTSHKSSVLKALKEGFKGDRNRPHILDFSEFGLVQMTRKRAGKTLDETLKEPCPCCEGRGNVCNVMFVTNRLRRDILQTAKRYECEKISVQCHKSIADYFLHNEAKNLIELQKPLKQKLIIKCDQEKRIESYKVEPVIAGSKKERKKGS